MTVIVSVKINDGIIMASDSASTFANGQTYLAADKIVNLVKGLPIGVMVTGDGGIGSESIATLLKDLRKRLQPCIHPAPPPHPWVLDPNLYTIQEVAGRVKEFLFDEKVAAVPGAEARTLLRVCGYSANKPLAEVWDVVLDGRQCAAPIVSQDESQFGILWEGQRDALNRLLFGVSVGQAFQGAVAQAFNIPATTVAQAELQIILALQEPMWLAPMPVQDAIDLARYLVETTIGFVRFSVRQQPKTVGGAVEIAAITKHEGFRWVQRRHFYPAALNPPLST